MRNFALSILSFLLLGGSGIYLLKDCPQPITNNFEVGNDNNEALEKRELAMLADPATGEIPKGIHFQELTFLYDLQKKGGGKTRGAEWTHRGPWNVGGRTRAIAVDKMNPLHILAGAVSGGIWQSMDGGSSWTKVSDPNGHPGVVSLCQDPRAGKTNIWYALSGELTGTSASGGGSDAFYLGDGAFKSSDNGNTWTPITSTASGLPNNFTTVFQGGWRIAAANNDTLASNIYMATYGAVFRSIDTGKTWKAVVGNSGNQSYYSDLAVSKTAKVYATLSSKGVQHGFYRSANGLNFVNITPNLISAYDRTVIEIDPDNEDIVYFLSKLPSDTCGGIATANYEGRVEYVSLLKYEYLSGDGTGAGGKWTDLSMNLPVTSSNPFDRFNCQGGYDLVVRKQPGSNTLIIGGTNLYRSTDAFSTPYHTQQIGGYGIGTTIPFFTVYLNHHPDQHDLLFLPGHPEKAISVCDGGIFQTDNINSPTVEWTKKTYGYLTTQLYSVAIDEEHPYDTWMLAGFQDNGNYVSNTSNPRHNWVLPVNGDGIYDYIAPDKSFAVMSIQQGRMVKVQLDKHGYLLARRRIDPAPFKKEDYSFVNPFIVDPNDNNILYTPIGRRIARLNNLRELPINNQYEQLTSGWTVLSDTVYTSDTLANKTAEVTALAVSKSQPNILYLGTNIGDMYRVDQANTGDPHWIKLDTASLSHRLLSAGYVSDIAVDPDSAQNVLMCYSNYNITSLFFSNNYGNTWYYVGGNLEKGASNPTGADPSIRSVAILVDNNGKRTYFAGTSIGLFATDTLVLSTSTSSVYNKTVWKQESPDKIGSAIVTDIKTRRGDGYVAIATHGNGAYESYYRGNTPPPASTTSESVTVYPNPASNTVYFAFDATNTSNYSAEVYAINGQRMASFSNGINNNGIFTQMLDVSSYPSGHYFITFYTSNHQKQVKHFVVRH